MPNYLFKDTPAQGTVREIVPGLYWLRMPLPMALDHINLYLLEDDDGWWVVDTGIAFGATETLWDQIFANELGGKPIKAVMCTHMHPDHIGMAGWLCEKWRVPFYMTRMEYMSGLSFSRMSSKDFSWTSEQYYTRAGFSADQITSLRQRFAGFGSVVKPMPGAFRRLVDGDSLVIKGNRWRVVVGRGHSPEHACLYSDALNILISGDQVIPKITSNVSVSPAEPDANPLKEWLASHEHFLDILPGDALILPAHNAPFHGLHERLRFLIDHHEDHLLALEEACAEATPCALELLPVIFKRKLDADQVGLALGECVAHLNYLVQRGQLMRFEDEQGRYRYRSIDETLPHRLRKQSHYGIENEPIQV
ncbi:MAG: MBL fold metallo-hydrolase [Halieaceae bacterium]|jgi:glyoxylase-like metal-dependent hydrolase (beta-lactamase superfamily II)|nr:MBL fold metallo-hydrolase [Halieaceae bacterium]